MHPSLRLKLARSIPDRPFVAQVTPTLPPLKLSHPSPSLARLDVASGFTALLAPFLDAPRVLSAARRGKRSSTSMRSP